MASVDVPGSLDSQKSKAKRKSYTREFKLKVVTFYRENNLYQTSKFFSLNTKTVLRWAQDEQKIEKGKKASTFSTTGERCIPRWRQSSTANTGSYESATVMSITTFTGSFENLAGFGTPNVLVDMMTANNTGMKVNSIA